MKESDVESVGTLAGGFVDYLYAFLFHFGERVGYAVLNGECHVVHAAATSVFLYELGDCAVGRSCFEKLNFSVSDLEERCRDLLVFHDFLLVAF